MGSTVTSVNPIRACLVPYIPFGLMYGGGSVLAEQTLEHLNALGHRAFWLDFTDRDLVEHTDVFHFFAADIEFANWVNLAVARRPVVVSSIFWEPSAFRRFEWHYGRHLKGTTLKIVSRLLHEASLVLPSSNAEAKSLQQLFGVNPGTIQVVPNGVDEAFVGSDPALFRARYLGDWPAESPFVLCVARIEQHKNQLMLAEACLRAGTRLVLVGQLPHGIDTGYQIRLLSLVEQHPSSLKYVGFIPRIDIANAYAAAAVHALVSTYETTGLVSLEAGLNGCNLVVGDCPPVREYFDGAAIVVHQDEESVRDGIEHALSLPHDAFGQSATIAERYGWSRVAELTAAAYQEAIRRY